MFKKIQTLIKNKRFQYTLYALIIVIGLTVYISVEQPTREAPSIPSIISTPTGEPFLPSPTTIFEQPKVNPAQTITTTSYTPTNLPTTIKTYQIDQLLVSSSNIQNMAFILGFRTQDIYETRKEGTFLWKKDDKNFSGSISLGQISYESQAEPSATGPVSSKDLAIAKTKEHLSQLLGADFIKTLDNNPSVNYMKSFTNISFNKYGRTTPEQATIFEVVYHQTINDSPILSVSNSQDNIIIAVDRLGNIDHLSISGGYLRISEKESTSVLDPKLISQMLPTEGRRVTTVNNISTEKTLSEAKNLNLSIKNVKIGYLQELNLLTPIYIIEGILTTPGTPAQNATYILKAAL